MKKILFTTIVAAALLAAGSAFAPRAEAIPAPIGLNAAVAGNGLVQQAAYVCRRVWRCGYYGCGWRRHCWWQPGGGYGWYGPRRYYGYGYDPNFGCPRYWTRQDGVCKPYRGY
jgi:hypothetical protein